MFTLNCKGKLFSAEKPFIMGILNSTPDSFYSGSRFMDNEGLLRQGEKMLEEGAAWLDIGGQSTRPGAELVGEEEELRRVTGAISLIHQRFPHAILSIDTWYSRVAREAIGAGASVVNDISDGSLEPGIL